MKLTGAPIPLHQSVLQMSEMTCYGAVLEGKS